MSRAVASPVASKTLREALTHVRGLYRQAMRSRDHLIQIYGLQCTPEHMRNVFRKEFSRYDGLTNVGTIDQLVFKGRLELEEANALWKTKAHMLRYFETPNTQEYSSQGKHVIGVEKQVGRPLTPFVRKFFTSYTGDHE